jgi:phosphoglucomutase
VVSSAQIDRVATGLGRALYEVPVGFKWLVDGLFDGHLGFGGEESAGVSFSRIDGRVWTTDKDGVAAALLAAEITARCRRNPGDLYCTLAAELGEVFADRVEAPASPMQKAKLARLSVGRMCAGSCAGQCCADRRH